ncbi:hypothetical protein D9M71_710720 [compost metagenome]
MVEYRGAGGDQPRVASAETVDEARAVGDEAFAAVAAAHLEEIALGEGALAVVIAQQAVGERHHLAAAVIDAKQRAAGQVRRYLEAEVVEHRGGQVDVTVDAALHRRQGGLFRGEDQVQAPG